MQDSLEKSESLNPNATILVPNWKRMTNNEMSLDNLHVNWKSHKKAERITMDKEVTSFYIPIRSFGWKLGWDIGSSVHRKAIKNVDRC